MRGATSQEGGGLYLEVAQGVVFSAGFSGANFPKGRGLYLEVAESFSPPAFRGLND